MNWLSALRAGYGIAVLAAPVELSGHLGDRRLATSTRRAMRVLAARQLFEAAVCAHNPTRCVLRLETLVDVIHGVTMAVIAAVSHNDSSRRAAAVNVATAAAFVGADVAAASRSHNIADSPGGNRMIRLRDQTARWLCRTLPYPAGMR